MNRAEQHVVANRDGNGFGRWNTMPTRRSLTSSTSAVDVGPELDEPSMRTHQPLVDAVDAAQEVDLPQPDGPISEVMIPLDVEVDVVERLEAVPEVSLRCGWPAGFGLLGHCAIAFSSAAQPNPLDIVPGARSAPPGEEIFRTPISTHLRRGRRPFDRPGDGLLDQVRHQEMVISSRAPGARPRCASW